MVKRSLAQSHDAPRRRSWRVICPPLSAFHSHTLDEFVAADVGALVLLLVELALDHHLGGDPGMVGADHPQRILALHPRVADQDVLQRVVERMADVEAAGDVGRRHDDRERLGVGALGAEQALSSQWAYQRASMAAGSKVLASSVMQGRLAGHARPALTRHPEL